MSQKTTRKQEDGLAWRLMIVAVVFIMGLIWAAPNFISTQKLAWWPTSDKLTMGLDIQGGLHLVMGVDIVGALKQETARTAATIKDELSKEGASPSQFEVVDPVQGLIKAEFASSEAKEKAQAWIERSYGNSFGLSGSGAELELQYTELYVREFKKATVERAIETIRNRIDEFGVAEPSIQAQGDERILVQLPGIREADYANAKELINKTARLDFIIVNDEFPPEKLQELIDEAEKKGGFKLGAQEGGLKYSEYIDRLNAELKTKIPAGTAVYFQKPDNVDGLEFGRVPYLLNLSDSVAGDRLTDAFVTPSETGTPEVAFKLDPAGAKQFGDMTTKFEKRLMAIVLDRVVKSAPVINTPITQGQGRITLGRGVYEETLKEAQNLSITLKSGALPAALEQLEERTVGPTLGADSIKKGQFGALVGAAMVFAFILIYYRTFGLIANLALAANLLLTIAVLSSLGATLTLPGVAGLALGLGIAVDANVIIFERIKEELLRGHQLSVAIKEGFDKAMSSIFDANITSIATCIVLYYFGTGPVRGFAVTLMAGLILTLFTAVFMSRALLDLFVLKWGWAPSIGWGGSARASGVNGQARRSLSERRI